MFAGRARRRAAQSILRTLLARSYGFGDS